MEEVEIADPGVGEIVVRLAGVGMCHTDFLPRTGVVAPPVVAGHEGAGVVVAVGPGVADLAVDDHVVLSFDHCGHCRNCLDAQPAYCAEFWPRNMSGFRPGRVTNIQDGAGKPIQGRWFGQSSFADLCVARAANAIKVDRALPLELLGPLSCGVLTGAGAVFSSLAVAPGSSFVVFGTGAVGLSAVMAARVAGATTIVAVDRNPDRLVAASEFGATHHFLSTGDDLLRSLQAVAPTGFDSTLDTTGTPEMMTAAIDVLRMRGVFAGVGAQLQALELRPDQLARGRTIKGVLVGDSNPKSAIPRLIDLWRAGLFPFDRLIQTFPLEAINDAERAMKSGAVIKPVLIPR